MWDHPLHWDGYPEAPGRRTRHRRIGLSVTASSLFSRYSAYLNISFKYGCSSSHGVFGHIVVWTRHNTHLWIFSKVI